MVWSGLIYFVVVAIWLRRGEVVTMWFDVVAVWFRCALLRLRCDSMWFERFAVWLQYGCVSSWSGPPLGPDLI